MTAPSLPKYMISYKRVFLQVFFQGKFYEQRAGTSMGSPLFPVPPDIFIEEFETSSLLTADLQPSLWLRYVDGTFVVWPHGRDALQDFLQYLNKQNMTARSLSSILASRVWHQESRWQRLPWLEELSYGRPSDDVGGGRSD